MVLLHWVIPDEGIELSGNLSVCVGYRRRERKLASLRTTKYQD